MLFAGFLINIKHRVNGQLSATPINRTRFAKFYSALQIFLYYSQIGLEAVLVHPQTQKEKALDAKDIIF
jgi:hypothetical protein